MSRLDQSLAVGDLQVHRPVLTFDKVIHSDSKIVDETVREITAALRRVNWFDDVDLVTLAIREALTNALVHGNRCDAEKTISISVSLNHEGSLFASISDFGSGFDPNAIPDPLDVGNELRESGRGIFLMRQVMDEVEFNFDHGTEVRMRLRQKWFE